MAIITICLNPTLQKTMRYPDVTRGEVNRTAFSRLDVSGKGINVTRVLTQLGKKALHLTQLGGDLRPLFLSLCAKDGLAVEWAESNSQIRFCYTVISENDNSVTELIEESEKVGEGTEERLLNKFDSLINGQNFSTLIISGKKATGFSENLIPDFVCKAKEKDLKIILDIRGGDLINSLQFKPHIIKPNLSEFCQTFNIDTNEQIKNTMLEISEKHESNVILTDSSRNIRVAENNQYYEIGITPVNNVINTTGCGDAFTAGLASALEEGLSLQQAITEGIRCGALNAEQIKPGSIE